MAPQHGEALPWQARDFPIFVVMRDVAKAMARALAGLAHRRMLALMFLPASLAVLAWGGVVWMFADDWARGFAGWWAGTALRESAVWLGVEGLVTAAWVLVVAGLLLPLALVTALIIVAVVAMPVIVGLVADRHFPHLERRRGGSFPGSLRNAAVAVAVFALLWFVTLPLWFTGVLAPVLPVLWSAYLAQRLFRYDALAEHAGPEEYALIVARTRGRLYALGALTSLLYFVPLANLVVPVYSGLAFTHLCLGELARLRQSVKGEK